MKEKTKNTGKLIIFSAPSGSGKTTIVHYLLQEIPELAFSISCATRSPRANEINGKDYYFLSQAEFKKRIDNQEFVEYEEVYKGNYYGTLRAEIDRIWANNQHVIFDIDVIGGMNIKKLFGHKALAIFVQPPSVEELKRRLEERDTETTTKITMRIEKATRELSFASFFDYQLINDNLEDAKATAKALVLQFIKPCDKK